MNSNILKMDLLFMNRIKKFYTRSWGMVALLLFWGATSCKQYVYDNLASCDRGVYINIYEQTECASAPSYPEVKSLHIYTFDEQDKWLSTTVNTDFRLSSTGEVFVPVPTHGRYSFVIWANIDDHFRLKEFNKESTRKDVLLLLQREGNKAVALGDHKLYVGETPRVIVGEKDSFLPHTQANIREITNRVNVRVVGFENPEEFAIEMHSNNATYMAAGGIFKHEQLSYPTKMEFLPNSKYPNEMDLFARFSTLKLETGRSNDLIIRKLNNGEEIFKADLVGAILLSQNADNINLRCLNDFDVLIKVRKCECPNGYMAIELWVNEWLVHSYELDLGA